ncbi:MAG TPA: hypothetical protein VKD26_14150 [Streptosporangiaceae bacterium]|nr:hypothetical protein [Streptosporangiaceae bacterium]
MHELLDRPGVHVLLDQDADRLDTCHSARWSTSTASPAPPATA